MSPFRQTGARRIRTVLGLLCFGGFVALLWAASWHVLASAPEPVGLDGKPLGLADRTSINLGALAMTVGALTLLVAVMALFGWDKLEKIIRRDVEEFIRERIRKLETLMEGRTTSMLGFAIGELSSEPDQLNATNRDRMLEAVQICEKGYELLKQTGERRPMLMGLNNLVYYSSIYGDPAKGRYLLEQARVLRAAGDELGRPHLLLTYCRAVLRYSTDPKEVEEARSIASEVLAGSLTGQQRKEAKFYLASLSSRTKP